MRDYHDHPKKPACGPLRGAAGDRWQRAYHATRETHVATILKHGLLLGGENSGVMKTSAGMTPWSNVIYGCHPAFLFLDPSFREDAYSWDTPGGEHEQPLWLEVDLGGLTLYADLWELRDVTGAWVCGDGLWWGRYYPDLADAPAPLQPFVEEDGVLTFEALLDQAAAAAIEVSRSAAVLTPIEPERVRPAAN